LAHPQTISVPQERLYLGATGGRVMMGGLLVGLLGFSVAAIFGLRQPAGDNPTPLHTHFWHAYLMAFAFFLAITLGALFFVMVHHLARAGWSVMVRRIAEGLASNMLLIAVLFLPIVYLAATGKLDVIYSWAGPEAAHDKLLVGKSCYLNLGLWLGRLVGFLVLWNCLAYFMRKNSVAQDTDGDLRRSRRMEVMSAPGLVFFGFSLTFAAFDLLMTLNPHWSSTMWGVYFFATCALSFFSTLVLLILFLQKRGLIGNLITQEHFHDLGKWMFTFTFFWGYIAFSQYMLIWYANLPEETQFFIPRQLGPWSSLSLLLLVVHLLIPFPGLLSRHVKRKMPVLAFWVVWSLLACLLDLFYIVMPNSFIQQIPEVVKKTEGLSKAPLLPEALKSLVANNTEAGGGIYVLSGRYQDFATTLSFPLSDPKAWIVTVSLFIGMAGLYVASTMFFLKGASLVPLKDPRLPESISFENA
jgi:hypothetical protein